MVVDEPHGVGGVLLRVLGPCTAETDRGEPVPLGPPKQRALLAALALRAGRGATVTELVDTLWPDDPPRSAVKNLQLYIHQLRKLLGTALGYADGTYRLARTAYRLDAAEFDALVSDGRRAVAAGDLPAGRAAYRRALAGWRGPALADLVERGLLRAEATGLEQARLAALDESVAVEARLGGPVAVLPQVRRLVVDHPLHEPFREHQVRGLLAAGRHAEASAAYREARQLLAAELGVAPGPALRALAATLRRDAPAEPGPAQLPADLPDFTGRAAEVDRIVDHLSGPAGALRICALSGTAGVGKSTLAVHAAHLLRTDYPDGQLHVTLHGQGSRPVDPADVLAQFLRALGRPTAHLPDDLEERVRLYRSALADRRVLVLLDDAAGEEQVRPLLPGGARCAALVTSRTPLAGLVGARQLPVDVLDPGPAVALLLAAAGRRPADVDVPAAEEIVRLCGRLPLAVRVAGARLVNRPHWTLTAFADRLADNRRRLDELRVGDLDVRASFQLSYDGLDRPTRRAFHLIALLDQPTVTGWLAAALLGTGPTGAERLLEALVDAQLLQATAGDRYRLHDLLRVYAAELAGAEPAEARRAAVDAALAGWVRAAEASAAAMTGPDADGARRWFAAEQADLVAAVRQAHRTGRWPATWRLAQALTRFLEERSQWDAWRHTHELARDAARRAGDTAVEATLTQRLGDLYRDRGRFAEAADHFRRALELAERTGSDLRRAEALRGLGDAGWGRGEARTAVAHYRRALPLFETGGDRRGVAHTLRGLSVAYRGLGRLDGATAAARRCLSAFRELGDRDGEAYARRTLGSILLDQGRYDEAAECFLRCRADFAALGDRLGEAAALLGLGMTQVDQGRFAEAVPTYESCRAAFADVSDALGEAYARRGRGDALTGLGRHDEAERELRAALALFRAEGDVRWQGYALLSLGRLDVVRGRSDAAREALHAALAIFERMAAALWIDRTRRLLAALPVVAGG
ncbi:ATP-binding protein [Micromonospora auratinigra]|uniref:DNA-binding transcriptional activator of the SARP family n=1 Tax=Micromonospora auratinigra TaxID=261654 RepID=A0A1A8ZG29_9ACTN|nr:tetratricopeptide repeat protein [Micromonospora auratinigra]SBT42968.1 DNA-binding transcriptional activator of the SARP family [Micromonospora auratinigra]